MLDKASFPRQKPCGGGISMRVVSRFPHLRDALGRIATHHLSRLYLEGPDGRSAVVTSDGPAALMIRRLEFDALLVSLAQEAGARLESGVEIVQASQTDEAVRLTARDGRVFTAPVVVAADGVHSIVARRVGINPGWRSDAVALDMMEETPRTQLRDVDPSTLWVAYGYAPKKSDAVSTARASHPPSAGYAYIFPKRDHVNVGIGYVLSHFRQHVATPPYALQRGFVTMLRDRGIVEGDSVRSNFTPFLIPVGGPLAHPARGRVLAAGDAGGFVNAFTAEGIYYAMVSGQLAARAIVQSRGNVRTLASRYRREVNNEIGSELRDSVGLQRYLFADPRRIAQVIDGAHREPRLTRVVLEFAMGRRSYRSARRRVIAALPGFAWRFLRERIEKRR